MALQYSVTVRNARAQATETAIGAAPLLRLYTGTVPSDCATAPTGVLQAEGALPSDWMANPSAGAAAKSGSWAATGKTGVTTANVTFARIYDSTGTTCHEQFTVGVAGSGADLIVDNTSVAAGQIVNINAFTETEANA